MYPPLNSSELMKVEASSSCFENAGKLGVIDVAQVSEERENWGKEYPFVEWAREEVCVDVGLRYRQV